MLAIRQIALAIKIFATAGIASFEGSADLIAVSSNPLEDVRVMEDVQWVMQGGIVVKED